MADSSITLLPTTVVHAAMPALQLVTVFTPPPSCTPQWHQLSGRTSTVLDADDVNCRPFKAPVTQYSPGLCRSGLEFASYMWYTRTGGQDAHELSTIFNGFCCSPGHTLHTVNFANTLCATVLPGPVTATAAANTETKSNSATASTMAPAVTVLSSSVQALSPMFVVFWQETDLSTFPETPASSLASLMGIDWGTAPEIASASSSSPTVPSEPGDTDTRGYLSQGAIAGISLGAISVTLIMLTLAYLAFIHKRKNKPGVATEESQPATQEVEINAQGTNSRHFSGGVWRSELNGEGSQQSSAAVYEKDEPLRPNPEHRMLPHQPHVPPVELPGDGWTSSGNI